MAWGFLNALYFLPLMLFDMNRRNLNVAGEGKLFPTLSEAIQIGITFGLTVIAWIFFRSSSISDAFAYIGRMFRYLYQYSDNTLEYMGSSLWYFIVLLLVVEWLHRDKEYGLQLTTTTVPVSLRWVSYLSIIIITSLFGASQQEFIYFQF